MLQYSIKCFWIQKHGNLNKEYEDAFKSTLDFDENQVFRVSISDGASESTFSAVWAKILTRSYRDQAFDSIDEIKSRLVDLSKRWRKIVFRKPLPWFAEEKARMGAFATFLGLEFPSEQNHSNSWKAVGVGDSCLFQIRGNDLVVTFPLQQSTEFGNFPQLLSSNLPMNQAVWEKISFINGDYQYGDIFILATDALAEWFLQSYERNEHPWIELNKLWIAAEKQYSFESWVENKRLSGMRNDDVTLVIIKLE